MENKQSISGLKMINAGKSPTGGDRVEVFIYDYIGPSWAGMVSAEAVKNELRAYPDADTIEVHINSGGGSIIEALAMYNLLNDHSARIEIDIDGLAGSSAGWVAMAGDEIRIAENAYFMLHDPTAPANGKSADLRSQADTLDRMKDTIVRMFSKRTGIDESEISDMMTAETWINGPDAVAQGFASKVNESKGYQVNCDLSGFDKVPDYVRGLANAAPPAAAPAELREKEKADPADTSGSNNAAAASDDAAIVNEWASLMV